MFFTQEDYKKIEEWLYNRTIKDTEFPSADPLNGSEKIPLIQDGNNKTIGLNKFLKELSLMELPDFFNVTTFIKKGNLSLSEAISLVPVDQRKLGLTITYHSDKGNWMIYQFNGTSINQWSSLNYWKSIVEEAIEEFVYHPDQEDITAVRIENKDYLKFKDKAYDPDNFSGMGKIILRKNLKETDACSIDDEDHLCNVLTQDMIRESNTIYIVQYDFSLDGKLISIPEGCILWFQGGSINDGTIYLQDTPILGAFRLSDIGNVKVQGNFCRGQVMSFLNSNYRAKLEEYFKPSRKPSSAPPEEDPFEDDEVFYTENIDAYKTVKREELRWWDGTVWKLISDITDYGEIKAIINDLIEKHNEEITACYRYFKNRIASDELDINDIIDTIDAINRIIVNLKNYLDNIEQVIEDNIRQYISNNVVGTASVTVNGLKYTPDSVGNINLPNYNVTHKLKFTGASEAEYDGSSEVTVSIPEPPAFSEADTKTLTIKNGDGESILTYNAKEDKEITINSFHIKSNAADVNYLPIGVQNNAATASLKSYDVDVLDGQGSIDLTKMNCGTANHGIVLFSGRIARRNNSATWLVDAPTKKHPFLRVRVELVGSTLKITLSMMDAGENNSDINIHAALAGFSSSTSKSETDITDSTSISGIVGIKCSVSDNVIYVRGIEVNVGDTGYVRYDSAASREGLLGFNIVVIGHLNR